MRGARATGLRRECTVSAGAERLARCQRELIRDGGAGAAIALCDLLPEGVVLTRGAEASSALNDHGDRERSQRARVRDAYLLLVEVRAAARDNRRHRNVSAATRCIHCQGDG